MQGKCVCVYVCGYVHACTHTVTVHVCVSYHILEQTYVSFKQIASCCMYLHEFDGFDDNLCL